MEKSNTYIFIYSTILVVIVAAVLSITAMTLQPIQDKNVEIEQKRNILSSVNVESDAKNAEELYNKYITGSYVVNYEGNIIENEKAFNINLKNEVVKSVRDRKLPVYEFTKESGDKCYIVPLRGKGLWGPIWGFISIEKDGETIFGTTFAHKGETPGLGAEIDTKIFQEQFIGKKFFTSDGMFAKLEVVKGGTDDTNLHGVDAISGGTITSKGLEDMINDCMIGYEIFFKNLKSTSNE